MRLTSSSLVSQPPLLDSASQAQRAHCVESSPSDDAPAGPGSAAGDEDPHAQQTTLGPELTEMLEFMAKFIAMLQQAQSQSSQDDDAAGAAPGGGGGGGGGAGQALPGAGSPTSAVAPAGASAPAAPLPVQPATDSHGQPPVAGAGDGAGPAAGTGPSQKMTVDGGGNHTIHLTNTSSGDEDIAAIRNAGPGMSPGNNVEAHTKLKPGESVDISMPDDWQGRFQDISGGKGGQSAWFEYNNEKKGDGKLGGTWFDTETTTGRDHSILAKSGGSTAGDTRQLLKDAPDDLTTTNSAGQRVIKGAELGGVVNQAVVDFESKYEPAKGQSASGQYDNYIMPNNDTATRHSDSNTMDVQFGDA